MRNIKTFEEFSINEGWRDITVGALATLATMGSMGSNKPQRDLGSEIIKVDEVMFKSPDSIIEIVNKVVSGDLKLNDVVNIITPNSKKLLDLVSSDDRWRQSFDKAQEILYNHQRRNSKFQLFLQSEAAKKFHTEGGGEYNLSEVLKLREKFKAAGLSEYTDFTFMVTERGINNWVELTKISQALDYNNGFTIDK